MFRESAVPIHLRAPSRALISLVVILFACTMAYLGAMRSWLLTAIFTFGASVSALALYRLEWAVFGVIVMSNIDGLLKPLLAERFGLFFKDYFVLLAVIRWLWGLFLGEPRPSIRTVVAWPALIFSGYVMAQIANPNSESLLLSLAGVRAWLIWLPLFFVAHDYVQSRLDVQRLWLLGVGLGALVGVYGIIQYFVGFEHLYRLSERFEYYAKMGYYTEEGTRILRVFGTMVHPGAFGTAMGFGALAASGLTFVVRSLAGKIACLFCGAVMVIGLFLSGSRAAMLSTAVGAAVFVLLARRPILMIAAGALLAVGYLQSAYLTKGGVESRLESVTWEYTRDRILAPFDRGLEIAMQHPMGMGVASSVGVGMSERAEVEQKVGANPLFIENDFGRALAELGVGAILYVLLLSAAAVGGVLAHSRIRSPDTATLSAALLGGAASVGITLAVGSGLYLAPGAPYFWLALGCVMRLPQLPQCSARSVASDDS